MTDPQPTIQTVPLPSPRQAAIGSAVAIVVATVAMVFFILPAELGIDLTGFGSRTGLVGLAQKGPAANIYLERGLKRTNVLFPLDATAKPDEATLRATLAAKGVAVPAGAKFVSDHWQYELLPYDSIEMKYKLAQGQPMVFSWHAPVPLHYDMHSVPDQGGNDATESFAITDAPSQTAVYVAPFTGIHGWFWQNQTLNPVTVSIDATGAFAGAVTFDQAGEHPRTLEPPARP
uniref:hypothetical protein n=1 Tax=Altererythrobacter segetis TaxID=1104773 RepID=UPI001A9C3388|nr:hypothetical protein [Altererythrobacter segetis]